MKVAILAGGLGTRLGEETVIRPKPMVEIGGYPILWHIMKIYSYYGFNEFIILCGYKGEVIKEYFFNYTKLHSNISIDLKNDELIFHNSISENWKVTLLDTGENTLTGGRIAKAKEFLDDNTFMLTYGDGVSDVNINELIQCHKSSGKLATLTAVKPEGRFGVIDVDESGNVIRFQEKNKKDVSFINGGFFVLEPGIFNYLSFEDNDIWEIEALPKLSYDGQLNAYKHYGFWKAMDMLKDKMELNALWKSGKAPWKIW